MAIRSYLALLCLIGCLTRGVIPAGGAASPATAAAVKSQVPASCSASLPKLAHHQSWESTRSRCAADITVVTHLASHQ